MDRWKMLRRMTRTNENLPEGMRRCSTCEVVKPESEFGVRHSGALTKACHPCRKINTDKTLRYRNRNIERERKRGKRLLARLRDEVLAAYGAVCVCCGEDRQECLVIDHIDNGGCKQRREMKWSGSKQIVYWLKRNGFPAGYQMLCYNCNMTKAFYGCCPDQYGKPQRAGELGMSVEVAASKAPYPIAEAGTVWFNTAADILSHIGMPA